MMICDNVMYCASQINSREDFTNMS
jgi:hypothetical protein